VPAAGPTDPSREERRQAFLALMNQVHAAEEHEQEDGGDEGRQSDSHALDRPLQVMLRFHGGSDGPLPVDVLEYGEEGHRLMVALPPDLPLAPGQAGEIHLMDEAGSQAAGATNPAAPLFRLLAFDAGRRLTLAMLEIESLA
jgi:hypothetical protein